MPGYLPGALGPPRTLASLATEPPVDVLEQAGFSAASRARIAAGLRACAAALDGVSGDRPAAVFFVPGRIEVLGKHTDYAGGRSLVCAVDRGFVSVACARTDRRVVVRDARGGVAADLVLDIELPASPGHWSDYVRTVVRRLARDFDHASGIDLAFASDLPPAAGLSTSSALTISVLLGLASTAFLADDPRWAASVPDAIALAGYASSVENGRAFGALREGGGVGTMGGSQDHTAILCARAGALSKFSFAPVRDEGSVRVPAGRTFVIGSTGVRAEKSAAALAQYNRLAQRAADAAALWRARTNRDDPHLGAALAAAGAAALLDALRGDDHAELYERAAQFVEETGTLIAAAQAALAAQDLVAFGDVVARSQSLAEQCLHNQIDETRALVRIARDLRADAASAFGAGFGGSVWAMVAESDAGTFETAWQSAYRDRFPSRAEHAVFFRTQASPAAVRLV